MGRLNVVIGYSCRTRECLPGCIFGYGIDWKSPAVSGRFYGTVGVVSDYMADGRGTFPAPPGKEARALPGLLAFCPSVVPIRGSWLIRHMAERISESDSDIEATVFADGDTYRSLLDCGSIGHVYVVTMDDGYVDWLDRKFEYRGWSTCKMEFDDPQDGVHVIEYRRTGGLDLAEKDIMDEIDRMEGEANDTSVEELDESDRMKLDNLMSILEQAWRLFGKYGRDMAKYLAGTTYEMESDGVGGDLLDDARPADLPDGLGEELSGISGDAMDSPASLRLVNMLANQLAATANVALKAQAEAKELRGRLETLDLSTTEALKGVAEGMQAARDRTAESIGGLRHQLALIVAIQRAKQWGPALVALGCMACCLAMALS